MPIPPSRLARRPSCSHHTSALAPVGEVPQGRDGVTPGGLGTSLSSLPPNSGGPEGPGHGKSLRDGLISDSRGPGTRDPRGG